MKCFFLTYFLGVYTRVSVYRDWINQTISRDTDDGDEMQLFNMENNIDMSNNLEIWWDGDAYNHSKSYLLSTFDLFCLCLLHTLNSYT